MKKILIDLFELMVISVLVFAIVYLFLGQLLEISGKSMDPYLRNGEQIIVEKLSSNFRPFHRGDVVVFKHPEDVDRFIVKRIIAVPGDKIKVSQGSVFVNSTSLFEEYVNNQPTLPGTFLQENTEVTLPSDAYFLMGDNREESTDSRNWGHIVKENIVGRAIMVYFPFENIRLLQ